jgi:hypothetical protein
LAECRRACKGVPRPRTASSTRPTRTAADALTEITRTAEFAPADATPWILRDIACPACGYRDPAGPERLSPGNRVRFFCDGCGAFVTILLSDAQAAAVRRWSSEVSRTIS